MNDETPPSPSYLVVGTVTKDVTDDGYTAGGTVTFSGRLAQALGCQTAVLTSASPAYNLSDIMPNMDIVCIHSAEDSVFDNIYQDNRRIQILHSVSGKLTAADVPEHWYNTDIVHLGPLTNEVDFAMIDLFPNSLIGITPQGWMRRWGKDGRVYAKRFSEAQALFAKATAVVISEEDLLDDTMLDDYIQWANILVMTENYAGCKVFVNGQARQVPAPQITLVEPTGAGDIFAAAFFVQLHRTDDPFEAAAFANHIAAYSVTKATLEEKVTAWQETSN